MDSRVRRCGVILGKAVEKSVPSVPKVANAPLDDQRNDSKER